jgi:PST family polysaccharide transporter
MGAQALLALGALALTIAFGYGLHVFLAYRPLLPFAFLLAAFRAVNPVWYFQGLERTVLMASVTVTANVAAAVGMLLLVHSPQDTWIPLALRAGAAMTAALITLGIAYRDTPFAVPLFSEAWSTLRKGWSLFAFKGVVSLYTTGNVVLLGLLASPGIVALFAGAEKIANAAASGVNPISQAFYPRISYLLSQDRGHAIRTARLSLIVTVGSGIIFGLTILAGAPLLVHLLLGPGFDRAIPVLRMLSVLPPLIATSNVLGIQWMLPLRLESQFNWVIVAAGVSNIVLALTLVPRFGHLGMAVGVDVAELIVAGSIFVLLRRRRLDPWSAEFPTEFQKKQKEAIAA